LPTDVSETRNLVAAHPDIAQRLHQLLDKWKQDVGARIPAIDPNYVPRVPKVPNDAHV
jgi:hypothetical protein